MTHQQKVTIGYVVKNPEGKVVKKGKIPFHSFLIAYYDMQSNFMGFRYASAGSSGALTTKDTAGATVTFDAFSAGEFSEVFATQSASASNAYGIQVGTGSTANAAGTFQLATLIANGSAATQLNYGSMGITVPSDTAAQAFTMTRTLTNNSGSTINITELGLVVAYGSAQHNIMITRDVFSAVPVLNGNSITFTMTLSYTVS